MPKERLNSVQVPERKVKEFKSERRLVKPPIKNLLTVCFCPSAQAENDVPQPQPPVAFGFSNVKPEPIMFDV